MSTELFKQVAFGLGVNGLQFVEGIGDTKEEGITCIEKYADYECL